MGRDPASSPDVWHGPGSSAAAAVMEQEKGKEGTHVAGIYPSETWCVDILSRPDLSYEVPGFVLFRDLIRSRVPPLFSFMRRAR
jgi:hypothetical protein